MTDEDFPSKKQRAKTGKNASQNPEKPFKKPFAEKRVYIPRITQNYFFNSALYYLQRYSSTQANLHRILHGKVFRARQKGAEIPADYPQWIDQAVEKCVALGYINDRFYAESKINSMRREGRSTRFIQQNLYQKGVPAELVSTLLQEMQDDARQAQQHASAYPHNMHMHADEDDQDPDLQAALRTIKRRNLVRADRLAQMDDAMRRDHYQKNLARLVRAGFSMNIARQALDQALDQTLAQIKDSPADCADDD